MTSSLFFIHFILLSATQCYITNRYVFYAFGFVTKNINKITIWFRTKVSELFRAYLYIESKCWKNYSEFYSKLETLCSNEMYMVVRLMFIFLHMIIGCRKNFYWKVSSVTDWTLDSWATKLNSVHTKFQTDRWPGKIGKSSFGSLKIK